MRAAGRDHHVFDRFWQPIEESLQRGWVIRIEGGGAPGVEVECCSLEALGITAGEDDVGPLGAGFPGGFEPDPASAVGSPLARRVAKSFTLQQLEQQKARTSGPGLLLLTLW